MLTNQLLRKTLSLLLVYFFLSGVQVTQALALEQEEYFLASATPLLEEVAKRLDLPESCTGVECISEAVLANSAAMPADLFGWIVVLHLILFITSGRECLETLDPVPCGAMVTHLMTALILGVILESF